MTPEAQRIAIAEVCGWKPQMCLVCAKCETAYEADQLKDYSAGVFCSECRRNGYVMVGVCHPEPLPGSEMPNYLSDLNAMHEAEKVLTDWQLRDYGNNLQEILSWYIVGYIEQDYRENLAKLAKIAHATASQRAEAFLKTVGKWEA